MRRHMRCAIALLALVALSGCGIERLTGPQVDLGTSDRTGSRFEPVREDDPKDPPPVDPGGAIETATDTLRAGGDDLR